MILELKYVIGIRILIREQKISGKMLGSPGSFLHRYT